VTAPATTGTPEVPPELRVQISTAHTLFFSSMVALLRKGFDSAVVAGTLMDCLANLLAQRPKDQHDTDLDRTEQTLRRRVAELAAHVHDRPPVH